MQSTLLQRRQRPCFDVRYENLKITMSRPYCANASGNYDVTHGGHIPEDFIGLASHSSSTQVGFPHPSTVPCDTAPNAVAERYIVLGWTSSMIGGPLLMGANQSSWTGLFYKASEFAWANFVHLEEFVFLFIKASACRVSCISGQWME